jgi:hypothetical protein
LTVLWDSLRGPGEDLGQGLLPFSQKEGWWCLVQGLCRLLVGMVGNDF